MLAGGAVGMALPATGAAPALLPGTALAFGMGWSWPGLLNFVIVRHNPSAPAVAIGINQTGVFAGGATGPIAFGLLVEIWSYRVAWSMAGAALLVAALLMTQGRRRMMADRARRAAPPHPARWPGAPAQRCDLRPRRS
jgi:predicted MFS family arabinose efflux permease